MTTTIQPETPTFAEKYGHALFIIALFITIFISVRLVIRPLNDTDYKICIEALNLFLNGQSPNSMPNYYMPPWSAYFLAPLANQPLETWLALTTALFVTAIIDIGAPSGLLLLAHPSFITLIASSNPEWLVVGSGLWLLYRAPRGWGRGIAWLLLTCKPQTTMFMLIFDGIDAIRTRDWKAIGLSAAVAIGSLIIYPQLFQRLSTPFIWSASVISNFGLIGALFVSLIVIALRWDRLKDRKTVGLLLAPIWSIYMLQYSYTGITFAMRKAGWIRTIIYVAGSIALAYIFWQDYHVAEQYGTLGMLLLVALLAPDYTRPKNDPMVDEQLEGM